jgi:tellurite resistance protein TehA-like permease
MATGIVSTAADRAGQPGIGRVLLVIAAAAFIALVAGFAWRLLAFPALALGDLSRHHAAFGYFTFVAGAAVLGERLDELHVAGPALALGLLAALAWIGLSYAVPARLSVVSEKGTLAELVAGNWLLWVVGTQSLATVAAMVAVHERGLITAMAIVAVWAWSVGVVLYVILMTILLLRLLTVGLEPSQLSASYWISMGATAITTLAGARILGLPHGLPILAVGLPVISGISLVLWCFGTWWIPLLVIFGVWRHLWRGQPLGYDVELWSIVFPLGMYAAASLEFGGAAHLPFMQVIGRLEFWPALIAWLAVAALGLWAGRAAGSRQSPAGKAARTRRAG